MMLGSLGHASVAHGQAPSSQGKVDAAKTAFEAANDLYKAGKLVEAIAKLEESYALSSNAFLLFNIGRIHDELGQKELALHYFRKFLASAPANAPMRPDVVKRVAALEKEGVPEGDPARTRTPGGGAAIELRHDVVETSPPGQPIVVTVTAPRPDLRVEVQFRGSDDETFTTLLMTPRGDDRVATIPGDRVHGNYLQYFIEAKTPTGSVAARVGRSTSPNLIAIEGSSSSRAGLELDPLVDSRRFVDRPAQPPPPYGAATLVSTVAAGALIGTSIATYMLAKRQSDRLRADATACGMPPCTPFDEAYDQRLQTLGERYNLAYRVSAVLSIGAVGAAGYFWYRRLSERPTAARPMLSVAPVVGDGFVGATTIGAF